MTHPIKEVLKKAKTNQKEVCEKTGIKQSTLSSRMNKEIQGSIEHSIEIAKEMNVKSYSIVRENYIVRIKLK